jgi:hypothetical protein
VVLSDITPDLPITIELMEELEGSIPKESIPEEISTLTRLPMISMFNETPIICDEDAVSLYILPLWGEGPKYGMADTFHSFSCFNL